MLHLKIGSSYFKQKTQADLFLFIPLKTKYKLHSPKLKSVGGILS